MPSEMCLGMLTGVWASLIQSSSWHKINQHMHGFLIFSFFSERMYFPVWQASPSSWHLCCHVGACVCGCQHPDTSVSIRVLEGSGTGPWCVKTLAVWSGPKSLRHALPSLVPSHCCPSSLPPTSQSLPFAKVHADTQWLSLSLHYRQQPLLPASQPPQTRNLTLCPGNFSILCLHQDETLPTRDVLTSFKGNIVFTDCTR